jgi:hypothetical protein
MRRFLPIPFTPRDEVLTSSSIAYVGIVLAIVWASDPLLSGILYAGSVLFGTLVLGIIRTRFRCFFTFLFCIILYIGMLARGVAVHRDLGREWVDGNFFVVFGLMLVFLVLLPTAIAWIITLYRKDGHVASKN